VFSVNQKSAQSSIRDLGTAMPVRGESVTRIYVMGCYEVGACEV
jgi:hypothetical protein